ncbi:MAG: CoA transferase [Chloroflexi bacterium]|nr:CoA transferase [Chloroflexota bacterium]
MPGPLEGVRAVELAVWVAGPAAGGILADWGADVVKLEPLGGDPFRGLGAMLGGGGMPPPFELDNRGKRSIALDLASEEGRAIAHALARRADVFLTNQRPAGVARLGLDYESLRAVNPRLVYAHVSAYGLGHEDADRAAFDVGAYWARGGIASLLRSSSGELPMQRGGFGDHATGANAAGAIAAALYARERTGEGQFVTTSLLRTAVYQLGWDLNTALRTGVVPQPGDRRAFLNPLINCYEVREGRWIWLLMLQGDRHWPDFCRAVQREQWRDDPRFETLLARAQHAGALVLLIEAVLGTRTLEEWAPIFDAHDVWWAPVQDVAQLLADPVAELAGAWRELPVADGAPLRTVATPADFTGTPWEIRAGAPELGQQTEEVLLELGYDWDRIAALKERGVIP